LSVPHNYFDSSKLSFFYHPAKILHLSAKSFFPCS